MCVCVNRGNLIDDNPSKKTTVAVDIDDKTTDLALSIVFTSQVLEIYYVHQMVYYTGKLETNTYSKSDSCSNLSMWNSYERSKSFNVVFAAMFSLFVVLP